MYGYVCVCVCVYVEGFIKELYYLATTMQEEPKEYSYKYKKIHLQELQPRNQIPAIQVDQPKLINSMNWKYVWAGKPVLYYQDTGIAAERILSKNGVFRTSCYFDAFLDAYTQHGDVVLVPDQIWIMIAFYLSTYIDKHAEKLRPKLVRHEGVKVLTVKERVNSAEESLAKESEWEYFFDEMLKSIEKETNNGVVEALVCNFTTTTRIHKVISTAVVMNSLQKLFRYHRNFCVCGISNVYMAGVRQDWEKMIPKLEAMAQFDVDGELKKYIEHMRVILEQFLLTFDEKPDIFWWNTVMKSHEKQRAYGGEKTTVDGWIMHFFGEYEETELNSFPEMSIKVPVKLINQATRTEKELKLVSDWVSVSKLNDRTYKPDVGVCIFAIGESKMQEEVANVIGQQQMKMKPEEHQRMVRQKITQRYSSSAQRLNLYQLQNLLWLDILADRDWSMLKELNLNNGKVDDGSVEGFARLRWPKLVRLWIKDNCIGWAGMKLIAGCEGSFTKLIMLDLTSNPIDSKGLKILLKMHLPLMQDLSLCKNTKNQQNASQETRAPDTQRKDIGQVCSSF